MINYSNKIFYGIAVVFIAVIFLFSTAVRADDNPPIVPVTPNFLDASNFKENEQSLIFVRPQHNDASTNIIFYAYDADNYPQYIAETIGHGDLPFSDYFAPAPGIGKYVAVEYYNDGGTFGCTGISLSDCVNNTHFINQFSFEITGN